MKAIGVVTPVWGDYLESRSEWVKPVVIVTPFIREMVAKQAEKAKRAKA